MLDSLHDGIPLATGSTSSAELRSILPTRPNACGAVPHKRLRAAFDKFWLGHISETIRCRQASNGSFSRQPDSRQAKGEQCDALLPLRLNCRVSPSLRSAPGPCQPGICRPGPYRSEPCRPAPACKPAARGANQRRRQRSTYRARCLPLPGTSTGLCGRNTTR